MNTEYPPVWILTLPRSGSTFVCDIFNHCFGNLCVEENFIYEKYHPMYILQNKKSFYPRYNKVMPEELFGFEKTYKTSFKSIIGHLPEDTKWIHLKRRDNITRLASYFILAQTNLVRKNKNGKDFKKVKFEDVVNFLQQQNSKNPRRHWKKEIKRNKLKVMKIYYEDFLDDPQLLFNIVKRCGYSEKVAIRAYENNNMKIMRNTHSKEYSRIVDFVKKTYDEGLVKKQ